MARLLVIEDNPTNRKLIVLILEKAGYTVRQAADAETGLAIAREDRPALILMDLQLPDMSGFDALGIIRQTPELAAIPVIAVTAMAMKGDAERIQQAGFDGCVTKPLRFVELLAAVASHFNSTDTTKAWKA